MIVPDNQFTTCLFVATICTTMIIKLMMYGHDKFGLWRNFPKNSTKKKTQTQ